MIVIDNTIVSDEIAEMNFSCNLKCCCGMCCIEGDGGAPLEEEEVAILNNIIDKIKPFLTSKAKEAINSIGMFDYDQEGNYVTPLINDRECAYSYIDEGVVKCSIEKAYELKKIKFIKPISCHLYPLRLKKYDSFTAINYHEWDICKSALLNGKNYSIPLYKFLEIPLVRKFGKAWYNKLLKEVRNKTI